MGRVQLITDQNHIREALLAKGEVKTGRNLSPIWKEFVGSDGHGRTGQVRESVWYGRSIILLNTKLNRGSAIDFINALVDKINDRCLVNPFKKLDKGGLFKGGSSDADIIKLFKDVCAELKIKPALLTDLKGVESGALDPFRPLTHYRT